MAAKRGRKPSERAYARLGRHERNTIELMLDKGASCRAIAEELGRAPSTVSNEVLAHRFVVAPRSRSGSGSASSSSPVSPISSPSSP